MKIENPVVIEQLSDWLPPDGEDEVEFLSIDNDIVINVKYTGVKSQDEMFVKSFKFKNVSHFFKGSLPSIDFLDFDFNYDTEEMSLDSLVEFKKSEFASKYTKYFNNNIGVDLFTWRHFFIAFLHENLVFHIIATEVDLSKVKKVT